MTSSWSDMSPGDHWWNYYIYTGILSPLSRDCLSFLRIGYQKTSFNTLRPRQMDTLSQTTFPQHFSSMKIVVFWLKFRWNMFARVQLTIIRHWYNALAPNRRQAIIWTNDGLVWWRIYASLSLNESMLPDHLMSCGNLNIRYVTFTDVD